MTGGAGFVGSHYVRSVLGDAWGSERPDSVVVLDRLTYAGNPANLAPVRDDPRLQVVVGDVVDSGLVRRLTSDVDAVVHFAAESHVDRSIEHAAAFVTTNVLGTQTLLDAALDAGVQRFVHVSTDEVYGSIDVGAWDEQARLDPSSPYSASKAAADLLALAAHRTHGLPVSLTRCSNTYGPYQLPEKLVPLFLTRLIGGGALPLYGDGLNVRDWLHVDDHCRAVHLVLTRGSSGEVYNVGGGRPQTNRELTARLLAAFGAGWDRVTMVPDRLGHDRRYCVDDTKIRTELGFAPRVGLEAGLAETVAWYREHRTWWEPLTR